MNPYQDSIEYVNDQEMDGGVYTVPINPERNTISCSCGKILPLSDIAVLTKHVASHNIRQYICSCEFETADEKEIIEHSKENPTCVIKNNLLPSFSSYRYWKTGMNNCFPGYLNYQLNRPFFHHEMMQLAATSLYDFEQPKYHFKCRLCEAKTIESTLDYVIISKSEMVPTSFLDAIRHLVCDHEGTFMAYECIKCDKRSIHKHIIESCCFDFEREEYSAYRHSAKLTVTECDQLIASKFVVEEKAFALTTGVKLMNLAKYHESKHFHFNTPVVRRTPLDRKSLLGDVIPSDKGHHLGLSPLQYFPFTRIYSDKEYITLGTWCHAEKNMHICAEKYTNSEAHDTKIFVMQEDYFLEFNEESIATPIVTYDLEKETGRIVIKCKKCSIDIVLPNDNVNILAVHCFMHAREEMSCTCGNKKTKNFNELYDHMRINNFQTNSDHHRLSFDLKNFNSWTLMYAECFGKIDVESDISVHRVGSVAILNTKKVGIKFKKFLRQEVQLQKERRVVRDESLRYNRLFQTDNFQAKLYEQDITLYRDNTPQDFTGDAVRSIAGTNANDAFQITCKLCMRSFSNFGSIPLHCLGHYPGVSFLCFCGFLGEKVKHVVEHMNILGGVTKGHYIVPTTIVLDWARNYKTCFGNDSSIPVYLTNTSPPFPTLVPQPL